MHLRPYQLDLIERTRQSLRRHKSVCLQAPTGAGKTAITTYMMARAAERGRSSMFCVHQNELLRQTSKALWAQKLEHGMVAAGKRPSRMPAQVASVQTLVRRLDQYSAPDLVIIDEAHRAAAATYSRVLDAYPDAHVIGLTATPERTDGQPLSMFSDLVLGPTPRQLIDAGYLCDYELFAPSEVDRSSLPKQGGDYKTDAAAALMDKPKIIGDAVDHYLANAPGERCVVMCVNLKHAAHVAAEYQSRGVAAEMIEGTMTNIQREAVLDRFERGETKVIASCALMTEGIDIPAIEAVQWLRPTQSLIVWMQGCGRGLRPHPGKEKLKIFDHVGNWHDHGLPDDDREWSLEGRKRRERNKGEEDEPDFQLQRCGQCAHVFRAGPAFCPRCGAKVEQKTAREIEVVEGKLEKIDLERQRRERRREVGKARTLRDLIELGVRRGMKKPAAWAMITVAAREQRKPTPAEFREAHRVLEEIQSGEPAEAGGGVF